MWEGCGKGVKRGVFWAAVAVADREPVAVGRYLVGDEGVKRCGKV